MAEPAVRFQYPETVPENDRLSPTLIEAGLIHLTTLFDPANLPDTTAQDYKEWKYAPTPSESTEYRHLGMTGVDELMAYRFDPPIHHPVYGHPKLTGYDVIGVPVSRSMVTPQSTGRRYGGFFFRSYFTLPEAPELPEAVHGKNVSLILDETLVFDEDDMVVGCMYRPYGADGRPVGPFSDTPEYTQHDLVGDQIAGYASGQPLHLVTARQAFRLAYPDIEFTSPEPPPFLESLQRP